MTARERLRQAIDQQQTSLRATAPTDQTAAISALVRSRDRLPFLPTSELPFGLVGGRSLADLGGNRALQLCLEAADDDVTASSTRSGAGWDGWAERFLDECGRLTEAELVLAHCETGFMRLVEDGAGQFDAWIATKRAPASWRERTDFDWWSSWLGQRHEPELLARQSARPDTEDDTPEREASYLQLAAVHLKLMAYGLDYPPETVLGGGTVQTCRDVLALLIARALRAQDRGEAAIPRSEPALVAGIAAALVVDPAAIGQIVADFTLSRDNAAYHAAVPGIAPPLIRVGPDHIVWSLRGLTAEPLLFLTREIRRRAAAEYHNIAHLRESVFRGDLYALFPDKRFVTSPGRIVLRRDDGKPRTDIDAVVFDRKTGALGVFELKSRDPFARSTAELTRQRDNLLHANHQLSGVLDWLNRRGANELLDRVDARTAKTFRVHKVYPFVLGRYLAHFNDGPTPDRRAAWGTWPQLLRLLEGQPFRGAEANPLASLFTRLTQDDPLSRPPADDSPREIAIGAARLVVHSSYAAYQASQG